MATMLLPSPARVAAAVASAFARSAPVLSGWYAKAPAPALSEQGSAKVRSAS